MRPPASDEWYFDRPALADALVSSFDSGLVDQTVITGRRRIGKTEFILRDLLPAAQEKGYITAYVNLWNNPDLPAAPLLMGLTELCKELKLKRTTLEKLRSLLTFRLKEAKFGFERFVKTDISLEPGKEESTDFATLDDLLSACRQAFRYVSEHANGKKILLCIDEAQQMTANPLHKPLIASLRTLCEQHRATVKVIFAGSNQKILTEMFNVSGAPFFDAASIYQMPLLGDDFLQFIHAKIQEIPQLQDISMEQLREAYPKLGGPRQLRDVLMRVMRDGVQYDIAVEEVAYGEVGTVATEDLWNSFGTVEKKVLASLAKRHALFIHEISRELPDIPPADLRQAINQLALLGYVDMEEHGLYTIEDHQLARWLVGRLHKKDSDSAEAERELLDYIPEALTADEEAQIAKLMQDMSGVGGAPEPLPIICLTR